MTPDICLGTDDFHTPIWLEELSKSAFEKAGYSVRVNWPFSGVLVPQHHYRHERAVLAIMIEINRRCYMDEADGAKLRDFDAAAARLRAVLLRLVKTVRCETGGSSSA